MAHRHTLPQGVIDAEATHTDARRCPHDDILVSRQIGSTFDDCQTVWGKCRACKAWLVSTLHFTGGGYMECRPMTHDERYRYDSEYAMTIEFAKPDRIINGERFPVND